MNTEALAKHNTEALVAVDVMTGPVLVAEADWPVSQLAEFLLEHGISGCPVTSARKKLIGVVSITDIVRHSTHTLDYQDQTHDYYQGLLETQISSEDMLGMHLDTIEDIKVSDIMTSMIFQVDARTPVAEIAETMVRGRIHRVFVSRKNEAIGVISALDLLKLLCAPVA